MPVLGGSGGASGQAYFRPVPQPEQPQRTPALVTPVVVPGALAVSDTAAFTGDGQLTAVGVAAATGTAAFTSSGTLSAVTTPAPAGTAVFAGSGTLTAAASPRIAAPAAFSGIGTLSTQDSANETGTAAFSADGQLTAAGVDTSPVQVQAFRAGTAVPFGHWRFPEPNRLKKKQHDEELLLLFSEV